MANRDGGVSCGMLCVLQYDMIQQVAMLRGVGGT